MGEQEKKEWFKRVLAFGYERGNEANVSAEQLVAELCERLQLIVREEK
ncbi:hypothetical protein [Pseudobacillus wudalianchiensis]|nr:hypothetical protein [Bacillus wudalianchiensis]